MVDRLLGKEDAGGPIPASSTSYGVVAFRGIGTLSGLRNRRFGSSSLPDPTKFLEADGQGFGPNAPVTE